MLVVFRERSADEIERFDEIVDVEIERLLLLSLNLCHRDTMINKYLKSVLDFLSETLCIFSVQLCGTDLLCDESEYTKTDFHSHPKHLHLIRRKINRQEH